jgi:hypothetical protein
MDTLNNLASQADELTLVAQEINVPVDGILYIDGMAEDVKKTEGERNITYARVRPFETGASCVAILGVPEGRIRGIQTGTSARFLVTPVAGQENLFRYAGHQPLAVASLAAAAKPARLAKATDVKDKLAAAGKAAPKAKL